MLRLLAGLSVLANLMFFVWAQGWFSPLWPGPLHAQREPQRLAAQLNPERVTVLPAVPPTSAKVNAAATQGAAAASSAAAVAQCLETQAVTRAEVETLTAALAVVGVPTGAWSLLPAPVAASGPANGLILRVDAADRALASRLASVSLLGGFSACAAR